MTGSSAEAQSFRHEHSVRFYDSDEFLITEVSAFLRGGLEAGEAVVVIATEAHRAAFSDALAAAGMDVAEAAASGRLRLLDARDTLDGFMVAGEPDAARFEAAVGGLFEQLEAAQPGRRVRAYGEMVDLLWRAGQEQAALRLEELWTDLQRRHAFALHCAYAMANFYKEPAAVVRVSAKHSHVVEAAAERPQTEVVRLLTAEVAQRRQLEDALRRAMEDARRQAEAARAAEEQLRDFVENGAIGMHWVGADGAILWANRAELSMLGYAREEYVGRPISDFHVDRPVIGEILERLKRREELRDFPARLRAKDGTIRDVVINSNVRWQGDAFAHTRCFTRDVTDQRRLEEERLLTAERDWRLGAITASLAAAVTPEDVIRAVVDDVARALNATSAGLWLTADESPGKFQLVRSIGYSDSARSALLSLSVDGDFRIPALDCARSGAPLWISSQAELLEKYPHLATAVTRGVNYGVACLPLIVRGRCLGSLGLSFDGQTPLDDGQRNFLVVVARHAAQSLERLRLLVGTEQARARAELLYGLAQAVITEDRLERVFEVALDGIEEALGASRSSVLTFGMEEVMRFRCWRGLSEGYRRAVDGHSPWSRETRAPEPIIVEDVQDSPAVGALLPVLRAENIGALAFFPLVASGRLLGKFMVYYDRPRALSGQERQMASAIAAQLASAIVHFETVAELRETVRLNDLYAGVLAHDLRNPLAAIRTSAELLLRHRDGEMERFSRPLVRIINSGERMRRMVDQLLDFTRVRVGQGFELRRAPADLGVICEQVADELVAAHPAWDLQVDRVSRLEGNWDVDRLLQIVSNLVANAGHHGREGGPVKVRADGSNDDCVVLTVHNLGAIPEAMRPALFDPLRRPSRGPGQKEGLGLGLFITRELAAAHGGSVSFSSTDEDGTTFTVTLPR